MLNQSCVCNLTNVKLPDFVLSTLSLGDKFNFALNNNKDIPAFEFIKELKMEKMKLDLVF